MEINKRMEDMDMSGVDSMSGIDMDSAGPFRPTNMRVAHGLWYGVIGVIGLLALLRIVEHVQIWQRQRLFQSDQRCIPSRPFGACSQAYATATATMRELCYPQPIFFTGRYSRYFTVLPVGRWLILGMYWGILLSSLWTDTIISRDSAM